MAFLLFRALRLQVVLNLDVNERSVFRIGWIYDAVLVSVSQCGLRGFLSNLYSILRLSRIFELNKCGSSFNKEGDSRTFYH